MYRILLTIPQPFGGKIASRDRLAKILNISFSSFSDHIKGELNDMFHCIQRFTNTCQVAKQVMYDIRKTILHKLQYITDRCACFDSTLISIICYLINKNPLHCFDPGKAFYMQMFHVLSCPYSSNCSEAYN